MSRTGEYWKIMLFNSSSNASFLPPHAASLNSSLPPVSVTCFAHRSSTLSFIVFSITNTLLLFPLCMLIICLGFQQWRKQRSASATETSHSDIFTYHMVAMEMIGILGGGLYCCGVCLLESWLVVFGVYVFTATSNGQIFFHILTCAERYLAVVHPILYRGLKQRGGVRIRNITIGCVWLLFLGLFGLIRLAADFSTLPFLFLMLLSIAAVSFCSLSVLRTLKRPGPGDGGENRGRADKTKMKAFQTITIILGALLLRFGGHVLVLVLYIFSKLSETVRCGLLVSGVWFNLPSSTVLPILFLHRARKLLCCKNNKE